MNGQSKKRYYPNLTVQEKGLDNTINQFVYY